MPTGNSPAAVMRQGCAPEWTYMAMFSCNLSMKAQAFSSPKVWIQAETWKYPVPDEAGWGMVILPLNFGSCRSNQDCGLGRPSFWPSTVLKHTAATQPSMPTYDGGSTGSRKLG